MPAKMARSDPLPPFRVPGVMAVIRAASLACQNQGKAPKYARNRESSGESRLRTHSTAGSGVIQAWDVDPSDAWPDGRI